MLECRRTGQRKAASFGPVDAVVNMNRCPAESFIRRIIGPREIPAERKQGQLLAIRTEDHPDRSTVGHRPFTSDLSGLCVTDSDPSFAPVIVVDNGQLASVPAEGGGKVAIQ